MLSRDLFDINMDLDYVISPSTMMRTEEVKNSKKKYCGEINNIARTANVSCQIWKRKPIKST